MSSFGSIEENTELSDMAVIILNDNKLSSYCVMLETFMWLLFDDGFTKIIEQLYNGYIFYFYETEK